MRNALNALFVLISIAMLDVRPAVAEECDFFQTTFLEQAYGRRLMNYELYLSNDGRGHFLAYCHSFAQKHDTRRLKRKKRVLQSKIHLVRTEIGKNRARHQAISALKNRQLLKDLRLRRVSMEKALSDLAQNCSDDFLAQTQSLLDGYRNQLIDLQSQLAACGITVTLPF